LFNKFIIYNNFISVKQTSCRGVSKSVSRESLPIRKATRPLGDTICDGTWLSQTGYKHQQILPLPLVAFPMSEEDIGSALPKQECNATNQRLCPLQ
jgi:hypothetical protein